MDLIVRGGTVVTMDGARSVCTADVVVRKGAIHRVGTGGSRRPARVLDATDCVVLPGLVQAHVHLCQALFRGMADDLPLLSWLRERIWPLEAAHDAKSVSASARLGLAEMMLAGTTCILDMGTVHHQDAVFRAMRESGIRGLSGKAMMDRGEGVPAGLRETARRSLDESQRLCRTWHQAANGRLGYAFAPRFILSCSDGLLRDTAAVAHDLGVLVHTHAAEHADERKAVRLRLGEDDLAALAARGISGRRAVLAHGVQLTGAEMDAAGQVGTRFVHCPSANLKLASGIANVPAMRAAGIVVGLGSDGAPCNNRMDPWTEMRQAALLAKTRGDARALIAADALAMATIEGARVLGLDQRIGSIEPGKRADLIVVRMDGLHTGPAGDLYGRIVYACRAGDVRHVVTDGAVVVKESVHQTLDVPQVQAQARTQARRVAGRAGLS